MGAPMGGLPLPVVGEFGIPVAGFFDISLLPMCFVFGSLALFVMSMSSGAAMAIGAAMAPVSAARRHPTIL